MNEQKLARPRQSENQERKKEIKSLAVGPLFNYRLSRFMGNPIAVFKLVQMINSTDKYGILIIMQAEINDFFQRHGKLDAEEAVLL